MGLVAGRRKKRAVRIRHQMTVVVDGLPVVLDGNPLVVAVDTRYVFRVHVQRRKAVDARTEWQVMFRVGASHQQC